MDVKALTLNGAMLTCLGSISGFLLDFIELLPAPQPLLRNWRIIRPFLCY